MEWICSSYDQLSLEQFTDIACLRQQVFIVEQNCAFQDLDGLDCYAHHLRAIVTTPNQAPQCVAYLRILPPGVRYKEASIGRVVTAKSQRGRGTGKELMSRGIQHTDQLYPSSPIRIAAQEYLVGFYSSFGFKVVSEPFIEDNISHVEMLLLIS